MMIAEDTRVEVMEEIGEYVRELLRPDTIAHLRVDGVATRLVDLIATVALDAIDTDDLVSGIKDLKEDAEELRVRVAYLENLQTAKSEKA